ncbi:MAG TPA: iron ABC transporter permease [Gemmatimonadales bacterium]|jgi:iron(III) transport system permease protein
MKRTPWRGLGLVVLLVWLVAYPISIVLLSSVRDTRGFTLGPILAFVHRPDEWAALWATLWISVASVILSALIGVPLAFIFERLEFPGRRLLGGLVALPVVLPSLVGVIAFLFLYGESGFAGRIVAGLLGRSEAPWRLTGAPAILLVHAYSMYVYFYLFTRAGLARMDGSMLEAAQALGASRWETLWRVTLPLLKPQLIAGAVLVFMTSLGSFSAPYLFGGGFRVMTTQIMASKTNGDMGAAMVETTVLALAAVIGLLFFRQSDATATVSVGKGAAPQARTLSAGTGWAAAVLGWAFAIFLLLPHLTLLLMSFVPAGTWTTETFPPVYSFRNYGAFVTAERWRPMFNSIWMALVATALSLALAVWAGRLVARGFTRFRSSIEWLINVPWAVPGTVLAIALATTFSVNSPLTGRWVLVGTMAILPLAYLIRNIPIAGGAIIAGYRQLDPALDEAAASLGATRSEALRRVTLPLLKPALLAGGALAFATAVGDFVASIVLYTYETRPVSMEILGDLRVFDLGGAAAYGVILMLVSAVAMVIGTRR